jgi:hypothetical protein
MVQFKVLLVSVWFVVGGADWCQRQRVVAGLVAMCVTPQSRATYEVGWRNWVAHAAAGGFDPWLRCEPASWIKGGMGLSFGPTALIYYIYDAFGGQGLKAATVVSYCAGVRHCLNCAGLSTVWFDSFPVRAAKSAIGLLCRQRKAVKETRRLPVSGDMIEGYKKWADMGDFRVRAVYSAMRLAFLLMLRVSEYVQVGKANHFLRAEDVTFILEEGSMVRADEIRGRVVGEAVAVLVDVRSAKNDGEGEGHRFSLVRDATVEGGCLCSLLRGWADEADLRKGQAFFSYNGKGLRWVLTRRDVTGAVKGMAVRSALDQGRYSTHSLRIGGASALGAARVPEYLIQSLGRWRSLAFLRYVHVSEEMTSMAQRVMGSVGVGSFCVESIRRLHPGVRLGKGG